MQELIIDKGKALQSICGDSPVTKVIDFFVHNKESEFTITEIAEGSKIARTTLWDGILKGLLEKGFLKKTREIGNAKLFSLNKESQMTKLVLNFYKQLLEAKYNDKS